MRYFVVIAAIIFITLLLIAPRASGIDEINLNKSEMGWTVTYQLQEPTEQLMFMRSPNQSRAERWRPLNDDLEIVWRDDAEVVISKSGEPFDQASFLLDTSYTNLPKDYAPFSPYSNGGLLIHTGRFFACIDSCTEAHHQWPLSIRLSTDDSILINGERYAASHEWLDEDSGRVIYVGPQQPVSFANLLAVIDPILPATLQTALINQLPMMMRYFTQKLEPLKQSPMLFASYSGSHGEHYGHQGGVLPNQIFMHWYGDSALENMNEENTLWFFAHEIAHLFQGSGVHFSQADEAWIHEGAAELMAYLYSYEQLGDTSHLLQTAFSKARQQCAETWPLSEEFAAVGRLNFRLHYTCGLAANASLHQQLEAAGVPNGIFQLWLTYSARIDAGEPATSETYFAAFEQLSGYAAPSLRQLAIESKDTL